VLDRDWGKTQPEAQSYHANHAQDHIGRTHEEIPWVNGYSGIPGNEKADQSAGKAAERVVTASYMSIAHLKLHVSERFRSAR
jgi:ribonuclease HI